MSSRPEVRLPAFLSRLKYTHQHLQHVTCNMSHACHMHVTATPTKITTIGPHTRQKQEQRRHVVEGGDIPALPAGIDGVYEVQQVQNQH